jgi:hypothetical protein
MTVEDIIKGYIKKNGYDGLVNNYAGCSCDLYDFDQCDGCCLDCEPAYKIEDPIREHDYLMTTKKPEK